jgi:Uma2 family endonuclease
MAYFPISSTEQFTKTTVEPLENGARLDQQTFHERYESMAEHVRAELIGGIVYMASPQKLPHGKTTKLVGRWLMEYEEHTPGTESYPGVTNILGSASEPEPDDCLIILPVCGGQTSVSKKGYLVGAPELIVETAATPESRDLHQKKEDYEKAGVREYIVVALRSQKVFWFSWHDGKFRALKPSRAGVFRSKVFPGLWLDPKAILHGDRTRLLAVLRQGLTSEAHQTFAAKLAARQPRNGRD